MRIELYKILVRKVVDGFKDNAIEGVIAYGGKWMCDQNISANLCIKINSATQ